jgi:hypothetical protein
MILIKLDFENRSHISLIIFLAGIKGGVLKGDNYNDNCHWLVIDGLNEAETWEKSYSLK